MRCWTRRQSACRPLRGQPTRACARAPMPGASARGGRRWSRGSSRRPTATSRTRRWRCWTWSCCRACRLRTTSAAGCAKSGICQAQHQDWGSRDLERGISGMMARVVDTGHAACHRPRPGLRGLQTEHKVLRGCAEPCISRLGLRMPQAVLGMVKPVRITSRRRNAVQVAGAGARWRVHGALPARGCGGGARSGHASGRVGLRGLGWQAGRQGRRVAVHHTAEVPSCILCTKVMVHHTGLRIDSTVLPGVL